MTDMSSAKTHAFALWLLCGLLEPLHANMICTI